VQIGSRHHLGTAYRVPMTDLENSPSAAAADMYSNDAASQMLGIAIDVEAAGCATATMTVRADMVNGLDVCHGGLLFALADTAMAFASNAGLGPAHDAFAIHADIDWLRPARLGDVVVAQATTVAQPGRTAVYDVNLTVADQVIAVFRGRTRTVGRS
jgi:acyl-CoA thioesterase